MDVIITDKQLLHQVSKETSHEEVLKLDLIRRIRRANATAWTKGSGLAAIQIGVPLRFAWFMFEKKEHVLLNPVITQTWGEDTQVEGCLSIPDKWFPVKRAYEIEYLTNGKKKRARGWLARIIQHEIDHMDGILIDNKENKC